MTDEKYEIRSDFYHLKRRIDLAVYHPVQQTERSRIAVLAIHNSNYLSFGPAIGLAKCGFTAAGAMFPPQHKDVEDWIPDIKELMIFMRNLPGVEKVILMGHSQGGCMCSCYQYIAENGISRFTSRERILPFPELDTDLPKADGLMLLDANWGIMHVLALDPAAGDYNNGYKRIPELDLFNPENGYDPAGSHYSDEFRRRYQKAQVEFYRGILAKAKERYDAILAGKGNFCDDEPFLIAGGRGASFNNKMFMHDAKLLSRTKGAYPVIHGDGSITTEQVISKRLQRDTADPTALKGAVQETVLSILKNERRFFDDFGYSEDDMYGIDEEFNHMSTIANVKGITCPLLCGGNTGSHEFVRAERNYLEAASKDKEIFFVEGARHMFQPLKEAEKFPGEFGDTEAHAVYMIEQWLSAPDRFSK